MVKVHYVTCPHCEWRFYIGESALNIKDFACFCPRCKHEFGPEESLKAG